MSLEDFFLLSGGRAWVTEPNFEGYLRITKRSVGNVDSVSTIDIANVAVTESKRGRGIFTSILLRIETFADVNQRTVFVESIYNERLWDFLIDRGYVPMGSSHVYRIPREFDLTQSII